MLAVSFGSSSSPYRQGNTMSSNLSSGSSGAFAGFRQKKLYNPGGVVGGMMRPRQPPKPSQLHYCEVCKISCAGSQVGRAYAIKARYA